MLRIDQLGRRTEQRHGAHQSIDVSQRTAREKIDGRRGAHVAVHADGVLAYEHVIHGMRVECTDEIDPDRAILCTQGIMGRQTKRPSAPLRH